MINFDDFRTKYTGVPVDFDGAYGVQCMDLMHQYVYDVCGLTDKRILAAATAYAVYANFATIPGHESFDKIDNSPTGVPQKGDIVFWNTVVGTAGHVAIFISGDANSFKSFDANWPTGTNPHVQDHNYNGVVGWLRFKKPADQPQPTVTTLSDQYEQNAWHNLYNYRGQLPDGEGGKEGNFEGFAARLIQHDREYNGLKTDLINAQTDAKQKQAQIDILSTQLADLAKSLAECKITSDSTANTAQAQSSKIIDLQKALEQCKNQPAPSTDGELAQKLRAVLYGKGFFWTKYWEIKELVPNTK